MIKIIFLILLPLLLLTGLYYFIKHKKPKVSKTQLLDKSKENMPLDGYPREEDLLKISESPLIDGADYNRHHDDPSILTFMYVTLDEHGVIIKSQERAIDIHHHYYKNDSYLGGYCLARDAQVSFQIDKIPQFTGNSESTFDQLERR